MTWVKRKDFKRSVAQIPKQILATQTSVVPPEMTPLSGESKSQHRLLLYSSKEHPHVTVCRTGRVWNQQSGKCACAFKNIFRATRKLNSYNHQLTFVFFWILGGSQRTQRETNAGTETTCRTQLRFNPGTTFFQHMSCLSSFIFNLHSYSHHINCFNFSVLRKKH